VRVLGSMIALAGACAPAEGPVLDRIEPAAAARGATVRLDGERFCGPIEPTAEGGCSRPPSGAVDFGLNPPMARAPVIAWGDRAIEVEVPAAAAGGALTVYVTVDGRSSNGVSFEVLP
jgi:hypothetical protein